MGKIFAKTKKIPYYSIPNKYIFPVYFPVKYFRFYRVWILKLQIYTYLSIAHFAHILYFTVSQPLVDSGHC